MKTLALLLFISISHIGKSQLLNINVTRQHWASGVCCFQGEKYTITFSASLDIINACEIDKIYLDGNGFEIDKKIDPDNKQSVFTYTFSTSTNEVYVDKIDVLKEVIYKDYKLPDQVVIYYNGEQKIIPITFIEVITPFAYP